MITVRQECFDASTIATNSPIFGKLNPNQNPNTPAMPKLPECVGVSRGGAIAVSSIARNPHLICAVHPTGSDTDTCPDF
ncbi:hypothetical protein QUB33_03710 [Microcoleus sp. B3-A4]